MAEQSGEFNLTTVATFDPRFDFRLEVPPKWVQMPLPEETVDWRKRRHVQLAALALLDRGLPDGTPLPPLPLRFDLVVVEPPVAPGDAPRVRHHRHVVDG